MVAYNRIDSNSHSTTSNIDSYRRDTVLKLRSKKSYLDGNQQ